MDRLSLAAIALRNIKTVGSFVGVLALLAASPASATLTLIDDPVFGPSSLVLDTTTNLEWLRVNLTYNGPGTGGLAVLAELGPGQEFAGFRFAGTNNWDGLMGEFGLPSVPGVSGCYGDFPCNIDPTMEANFTSLFGIPFGAEVDYNYYPAGVSGGPGPFFDEVVFFPGNMTSGYTISSYLIYSGFTEGCYVGGVIPCLAALVRDAPTVPEPPSIWMLIAGLLAFPVARRLKRRAISTLLTSSANGRDGGTRAYGAGCAVSASRTGWVLTGDRPTIS